MSTPLINGIRHAFGSIKTEMLGRSVTGFTMVSYEDNQEKVDHYGQGNYPSHRGHGKYSAKAKIGLYAFEVDAILKALGPGKRLQDIGPFDVTVTYMPVGSDGLITHVIRNCEFTTNKREVKSGDTTISFEHDLVTSHIQW